MNRFTRMLERDRAVVNFIDLDEQNKQLASSGPLSGRYHQEIEFDPTAQIKKLTAQGYELAKNGFNPKGQTPYFGVGDTFVISFRHAHKIVDPDHLAFDFKKEQLEKSVKQVIHYAGAANRTPVDNISYALFKRQVEVDLVTKKVIKDKGFQPKEYTFRLIGTPTLSGFYPDKTVAGGKKVTPDSPDQEETVTFAINNQPSTKTQHVLVDYVDLSNNNDLIFRVKLSAQANMPIEYDPEPKIKDLARSGYELVNNGFQPAKEVEFFGNKDGYTPTFIITMKSEPVAVNSEHPSKKIKKSAYEQQAAFVVNFVGAGRANPVQQEQIITWTRTVTAIKGGHLVTNGRYDTPWQAQPAQYHKVAVPVVHGFHTRLKEVEAPQPLRRDQVVKVKYLPNGRLIPVDEKGQIIIGAPRPQFNTSPVDPRKVSERMILPDIAGYNLPEDKISIKDPDHDLKVVYKSQAQKTPAPQPSAPQPSMPEASQEQKQPSAVKAQAKSKAKKEAEELSEAVNNDKEKEEIEQQQRQKAIEHQKAARELAQEQATMPQDAGENKLAKNLDKHGEMTYDLIRSSHQVAFVNFIDLDNEGMQLTSSGPLVGEPGESINDLYSTAIPLRVIRQAGYEVVFNTFDKKGVVQRFNNNDLLTQIFTIGVRKKRTNDQ